VSDIFSFIQLAWKNTWKQKTIWLFSALYIVPQLLFQVFPFKPESNLLSLSLSAGKFFISVFLWLISTIGIPYLAYCFAIGKTVNIHEVLLAINKFSGRAIRFSCLSILMLVPCLFLVVAYSTRNSTFPANLSTNFFLISLPLSIFGSIWDFSILGFFAKDLGIRKSLKEAWTIFMHHFGILALLGLTLTATFTILRAAVGILTFLIRSGFKAAFISNLDFINPQASLNIGLTQMPSEWQEI